MATLHGTCLCGGVKFEVEAAPDSLRFCHCTSCKKLSGGGGTVNFGVPPSAITIVQGQELLQSFTPEGGSAKTFCRTCGTNLFGGGWPDTERASVRVPTIEDPTDAKVGAHIYARSVAPWETLPDDGAERFETTSG
ncbi:MAG: GFA family protein [Actinobacteria bacterium]|nr:MAG: GFA family protein [Actinomycetota bacterium]